MYGMVLMAALAAGPQAPAGGFGFGCGGCTGCSGTVVVVTSGCTGCYSSCTGCTGSCHGGPLFPRINALFSNLLHGGCCGGSCHSSCHGSSCHATVTSCSGCYSSCHGSCYGHHSSCFGSSCHGSSCFGSSCHGGAVYYGSDFTPSHGCGGMIVGSAILPGNTPIYGTPMASAPAITIDRTSEYRASVVTPTAAPARLTIEVPANVKLYVDGALTKGEGESRNFHTPELQVGKSFYYELKAELTVNGKTVTEEKRVTVKAGEALTEQFPKLTAAAKAATKGELSAKK